MAYFLAFIVAIIMIPKKGEKIQHISSLEHSPNSIYIKRRDLRSLASFLAIFVVSAVRYGVGTDYFYTYVPGFIILRDGRYTYDYYEKGFELLNHICIAISENYQVIFVATSLIIYAILFYVISRYSKNPKASLFVYFCSSMYFNSLSNIRQGIASVICLAALAFYMNTTDLDSYNKRQYRINIGIITLSSPGNTLRRLILYYVLIFIAFEFHESSVIFVIVPLLGLVKGIKLKNHLLIATVLGLIALALNYMGYIATLLNYALQFLDRYQRYTSSNSVYWSFLIFNIGIYLIMYCASILSGSGNSDDRNSVLYLNIQFIAVVILLFSNIIPWADRLSRYFMIVQCLSVPNSICGIHNKKNRRTVTIAFIILYLLWILFYILSYGADGCFPYQNIFSVDTMWQKGYFGN